MYRARHNEGSKRKNNHSSVRVHQPLPGWMADGAPDAHLKQTAARQTLWPCQHSVAHIVTYAAVLGERESARARAGGGGVARARWHARRACHTFCTFSSSYTCADGRASQRSRHLHGTTDDRARCQHTTHVHDGINTYNIRPGAVISIPRNPRSANAPS